jgi:hypothetical protein
MNIFDSFSYSLKQIAKFVLAYSFFFFALGFVLGAWWARSA